ncbi:MAG: glycosyltransferase, partial [Gammaproteobacteria bacterium]
MSSRRPRVLMLGWEYPPLFAGGLGKASQGLARGLAACGAEVLFVLPSFRRQRDSAHLKVAGVRDWLRAGSGLRRAPRARARAAGLNVFALPARLYPYQRQGRSQIQRHSRYQDQDPRPAGAADRGDVNGFDPLRQLYGEDLGRKVSRFAAQVARLAARLDADVVHANDWMSFPAAFAAAAPRRLPVFVHVHSTEYDRSGEDVNPYIAGIEHQACARATHVFAVSRYTANVLASRYAVPRNKITVVYNAPDEPMDAAAEDAADPKRVPWVVFLGRLTFQKGPDHFLRAAARVAEFNREARFLVCGSGDMSDGLHALAQALGIAARVEFRGFVQPAAVDRLLARSRMLVMSSVSEPFGLVALEALRDGTPVILSKQSGVREVLGHSLQ